MFRIHHRDRNYTTAIEVLVGVLLLLCGSSIYLLFRSKSLKIYQWCDALGLSEQIDFLRDIVRDWNVPDCLKFSLPDGVYNAAYILIIDAIWRKEDNFRKHFIVLLVPTITICSELFQGINLVKGTYDSIDLMCYALPPLVYICILIRKSIIKIQRI